MTLLSPKMLLQARVDAFNAGYGKKVQRVIYCKYAKKYVIQMFNYYNSESRKEWFCLH